MNVNKLHDKLLLPKRSMTEHSPLLLRSRNKRTASQMPCCPKLSLPFESSEVAYCFFDGSRNQPRQLKLRKVHAMRNFHVFPLHEAIKHLCLQSQHTAQTHKNVPARKTILTYSRSVAARSPLHIISSGNLSIVAQFAVELPLPTPPSKPERLVCQLRFSAATQPLNVPAICCWLIAIYHVPHAQYLF